MKTPRTLLLLAGLVAVAAGGCDSGRGSTAGPESGSARPAPASAAAPSEPAAEPGHRKRFADAVAALRAEGGTDYVLTIRDAPYAAALLKAHVELGEDGSEVTSGVYRGAIDYFEGDYQTDLMLITGERTVVWSGSELAPDDSCWLDVGRRGSQIPTAPDYDSYRGAVRVAEISPYELLSELEPVDYDSYRVSVIARLPTARAIELLGYADASFLVDGKTPTSTTPVRVVLGEGRVTRIVVDGIDVLDSLLTDGRLAPGQQVPLKLRSHFTEIEIPGLLPSDVTLPTVADLDPEGTASCSYPDGA